MKMIFISPHKRGFILLPVLLLISIFMGMLLIEFQEVFSLFHVHQLISEKERIENGQECLKNITEYEKRKMENYLKMYPHKTLYHYLTETENQNSLLLEPKGSISSGGYHLENVVPNSVTYDTWKGYFIKYYEIVERKQKYKIRFMVEYQYGKKKIITEFISYKIIEMEVYLL